VALREIRRYTRNTDLLIPRTQFGGFVREIVSGIESFKEYEFQASAIGALQAAAEAHLVRMFEGKFYSCPLSIPIFNLLIVLAANLCAIHGKRVTVQEKDITLVRKLCNGWSLDPVSNSVL
jgi:histone H3